MGCGTSATALIHLDRIDPFYYTEETVSGRVDVHLYEANMKIDAIYLVLKGEIGYKRTRTRGTGKSRSQYTEYLHIPFYSFKMSFGEIPVGQDELKLDIGPHSWPFQIQLPSDLPPTVHNPTTYPHVRYYLQLVIDKPWYQPNTREIKYIFIYPRVDISRNPSVPMANMFSEHNRKEVQLKIHLEKNRFVPGETILLKMEITNPQKILIKQIDLSMYQFCKLGPTRRGFSLFRVALPNTMNIDQEYWTDSCTYLLPNHRLPPSYEFYNSSGRNGSLQILYFLKFDVRVAGIFTDFDVRIPFLLGTHPKINNQKTSVASQMQYSAYAEDSMDSDDDGLEIQTPHT